jgi:hypothetical protein
MILSTHTTIIVESKRKKLRFTIEPDLSETLSDEVSIEYIRSLLDKMEAQGATHVEFSGTGDGDGVVIDSFYLRDETDEEYRARMHQLMEDAKKRHKEIEEEYYRIGQLKKKQE